RRPCEAALEHPPDLRELVHQARLSVQPAGRVDDHDVATARDGRLDRVVGDGRRIGAPDRADEVGVRALRPDLELLLGGGAEGVGGRDEHRAAVLAQLLRELPDRRRLAGAVDADDEDDGGTRGERERRRSAEQARELLRQRLRQVARAGARLEPADELRRRPHAHVRGDQRLLESLPGRLVGGVERGQRELARERAPAPRERVAQAREEARPLRLRLGRGVGLAEQLRPAPRHGGEPYRRGATPRRTVTGVILGNGVIRTLEPSLPTARALAIADDRIAGGVGTHERSLPTPERVDLGGRCVLPGFTDSHVHFPSWAIAQRQVRLEGAATLEEALARVRAATARGGEGWVLGQRWRSSEWREQPTKEALDAVTGSRPAALLAKDYHSLWLNSAALALAEGDLAVPGGIVERDAGGEPTGVLREE